MASHSRYLFPWNTCFQMNLLTDTVAGKFASVKVGSDSFTILGLWVLGLAVPYINESQLQTYESKTLLLMTTDKSAILLYPGTCKDSLK